MKSTKNNNQDPLQIPVQILRGVGPTRIESLYQQGVYTLGDLLFKLPRRYETWLPEQNIASIRPGNEVTVRGVVEKVSLQRFRWRKSYLRVRIKDSSGAVDALFFNQHYLESHFQKGQTVTFHGKVAVGKQGLVLPAPKVETGLLPFPKEGQIFPVYATIESISGNFFASLITQALQHIGEQIQDPIARPRLQELKCFALGEALHALHKPKQVSQLEPARRRLALEEFIKLQRAVHKARIAARKIPGVKIVVDSKLYERILKRLPFTLTEGQRKTIAEIRTDLASGYPMRRLIQGDVSCGKTAIAVFSCLAVIGRHYQAAFMAPTEILAEQHARVMRRYLENSQVNIALLRGSMKAKERKEIVERVAAGDIHLLIGTHALIQGDVRFKNLALVVIDEQHRFGVAQRERLFQKGNYPHLLTMTATPIPRTLALTVYGDLDVSLIRDKPPGRGEIKTHWVRAKEKWQLLRRLREHLQKDDQIYWIAPRIEEDEEEGRSANAIYSKLSQEHFKDFPLGIVHGKMPAEERDQTLEGFRQGKIKLLVATTLVEVGIDVPQARVIVISGAERLGLAQLHQLRGRVGRDSGAAFCYLMGASQAAERFRLLEKTNDGFEIAEADLQRRGAGELSGQLQSGHLPLAAGNLNTDLDLLLAAREEVKRLPLKSTDCVKVLLD